MDSLRRRWARRSNKTVNRFSSPSGVARRDSPVAPVDGTNPGEGNAENNGQSTRPMEEQAVSSSAVPEIMPVTTTDPERAPRHSLWERAYEELQEENSPLIDEYEGLLSKHLTQEAGAGAEPSVASGNSQQRMKQITEQGLKHLSEARLKYTIAGKEHVVIDQVSKATKVVLAFKEFIADAIKASPEASMAWAGVSIILPLITNPSEVEAVSKSHFQYVASRMKFYSGIEALLWPQNLDLSQDVRTELEECLVKLYTATIKFHVESALRFYRHWLKRTLRDLIKYDDWNALLKAVTDAEDIVKTSFRYTHDAAVRAGFLELGNAAKEALSIASLHLQASTENMGISTKQLGVANQMNQKLADIDKNLADIAHSTSVSRYLPARSRMKSC